MKDCVNCAQKKWVQLEEDRSKVVMRCPIKNKDVTAVNSVDAAKDCASFIAVPK